MRKILGIDAPTREQARKALERELEERLMERNGIILPRHYASADLLEQQEKKQHVCEGCGQNFSTVRPKAEKPYFGQFFCEECYIKWTTPTR